MASSSSLHTTDAFQPPKTAATPSSSSKLDYVVFDGDQQSVDSNNIQANAVPKKDYAVANHDNERSFWLQALQNLEGSSSSTANNSDHSMWTKIACAFAPKSMREQYVLDPSQTIQEEAHLVRVGDTDLDIAVAVPPAIYEEAKNSKRVVSNDAATTLRKFRRRPQVVTIRVDFPEGSAFDKDAYTFEDELSAVIRQVRLLERTAEDKLSGMATAH